jgi:hypothetical protein
MIIFKKTVTLTVITEFDEATDNITGEEQDTFKAGELVAADILDRGDNTEKYVDLQFGDGSMAFGVERDSFDVV